MYVAYNEKLDQYFVRKQKDKQGNVAFVFEPDLQKARLFRNATRADTIAEDCIAVHVEIVTKQQAE